MHDILNDYFKVGKNILRVYYAVQKSLFTHAVYQRAYSRFLFGVYLRERTSEIQ